MSDYPPNHRFAGRFIRLRQRLLNVDMNTLAPSNAGDVWTYIDPSHVVRVKAPLRDDGDVAVTLSYGGKEHVMQVAMSVEAVLQALEPVPPPPVTPVKPWDRPPEVRWEDNKVKLGGGVVTGYARGNIRNDRPTPFCPKCLGPMKPVNSTFCCEACGAQREGPTKCPDCDTPMTTVRGVVCCPNCGS